jgi:hypothetical protein
MKNSPLNTSLRSDTHATDSNPQRMKGNNRGHKGTGP